MKTDFTSTPPLAAQGLPFEHLHFSGGRTGLTLAGHGGIIHVFHYGNQALRGSSFFQSILPHSSWPKLFRLAVLIEGRAHYPDFHQTRFYPFGFTTEDAFLDVRFAYEVLLLNDALVQRIRVLRNPKGRRLQLKVMLHGFAKSCPSFRTWSSWRSLRGQSAYAITARDVISHEELRRQIEERKLNPVQNPTFENEEVAEAGTHIGVTATQPLSFQSVDGVHEGFKQYFRVGDFDREAAIAVCFQPSAARLSRRLKELSGSAARECDVLRDSYQKRLAGTPRIKVNPSELQSCLENIPPSLDSLKIPGIPGALRASSHGYWVWSWDSLVYPGAHLWANDPDFIRDVLRFAVKTADPELGIPHQFNTRLVPQMAMAFPVQCLFITTLYSYYCHTRDVSLLHEGLPLARWILSKCWERESRDTGLIEGTSLYPDYPGLLGQDGRDISVFNNSVYYQGLMAMRYLAAESARLTGQSDAMRLAQVCEERAARTRDGFLRYFYDSKVGGFLDSLSSEDLTPRHHYPVYAILWCSGFAADLLGDHTKSVAAFMGESFVRPHGLGMFPEWDEAWMRDGNQFGAYYPVVEPFFRNVQKAAGQASGLRTWAENVAWFWSRLTIPEGLTFEADNELPDNPGTRQAFAAKAWYEVFFRCVLGLDVGEQGLTVSPGPFCFEVGVKDILLHGKELTVSITGSGKTVDVLFNGKCIPRLPFTIPLCELRTRNTLAIHYRDASSSRGAHRAKKK